MKHCYVSVRNVVDKAMKQYVACTGCKSGCKRLEKWHCSAFVTFAFQLLSLNTTSAHSGVWSKWQIWSIIGYIIRMIDSLMSLESTSWNVNKKMYQANKLFKKIRNIAVYNTAKYFRRYTYKLCITDNIFLRKRSKVSKERLLLWPNGSDWLVSLLACSCWRGQVLFFFLEGGVGVDALSL